MFGYPCPFCSQKLLAAPERAGQRTICPKCLKPIVIPKPDEPTKPEPELLRLVLEPEADEVPISMMPVDDPDEPLAANVPTPMPEHRPPARIGVAVGTAIDPIPLQAVPSLLQPAAAYLVRNPDSVIDLLPPLEVAATETTIPDATPFPNSYPMPEPALPEPVFSGQHSPYESAYQPQTFPQRPQHQYQQSPYSLPQFPSPGTLTGDHPAASLPPPLPQQSRAGQGGLVVFNPTDVEAADIAAELTQAISSKMAPPQTPPSDLRLTTGLWLILTSSGIALWVYCMIADMEPLRFVAIFGAVELIIGYLWVAIAFGKRNVNRGLTTLLPPVWVYRAANPPYEPGYRPLRYVVAGAVLLALYVLGPKAQPTLYEWFGLSDPSTHSTKETIESPHEKLLEAERQKSMIEMYEHLRTLAKPESLLQHPSSEKPKVIATLRRLRKHERGEVRADALHALYTWAQDDAKGDVLAALQSSNSNEMQAGYDLIVHWNDTETVKLLVGRLISARNDNTLVTNLISTLKSIGESERGRTSIEDVILPILEKQDRGQLGVVRWMVIDFGGPRSLLALEKVHKEIKDRMDADEVKRMMNALKDRLQK